MPNVIQRPSPNHGKRPEGVAIDCLVLHADAGRSEEGTLSWLANPASKVSYHYLVGRTGTVYQCVPDKRRAWHAGVSTFKGRANVNDCSLGVSFANRQDGEPFPGAQLAAGAQLVADLCRKHAIPLDRITTHAIISPGRKHDPGPLFPLATFVRTVGALLSPEPAP